MLESEDQKKAADTAEVQSHAGVQTEVVIEQEPIATQEPTIAPEDHQQFHEYYGEMKAKAASAEAQIHCQGSDANAAAEPESEDDLRDYEYYEQLEQKEVLAAGPEDELPDFEYYEELEQRQAAEKIPKAQTQHSTPELVATQQPNSYSAAASPSLAPFSNAHLEAGANIYPTPSLSSSPVEVDMQYDADAESDADSPNRSFVCARNRLIGQVKAQRKANKGMRNRLRRIEGCKKYESATLKSLEKELGALKDEGQDLEMKLGMAQVEALIRIQGARKANGGAGN
ncbi:hypothetical protein N0V85_008053 [Neurospora sp. IMI 360204]|nr:hypothetical protein N0V85_008053 [Neurospora sp. IMI 360204]